MRTQTYAVTPDHQTVHVSPCPVTLRAWTEWARGWLKYHPKYTCVRRLEVDDSQDGKVTYTAWEVTRRGVRQWRGPGDEYWTAAGMQPPWRDAPRPE